MTDSLEENIEGLEKKIDVLQGAIMGLRRRGTTVM